MPSSVGNEFSLAIASESYQGGLNIVTNQEATWAIQCAELAYEGLFARAALGENRRLQASISYLKSKSNLTNLIKFTSPVHRYIAGHRNG